MFAFSGFSLGSLLRAVKTRKFAYSFLLFSVLAFIFVVNGLHESYPDEFDNILGGWYILHGHPLYSTFFTHHGPTSYFLAAIVEILSGNSFFRFRMVYSVLFLASYGYFFWYFRKSLGVHISRFFPLFLLFIGVGATYFWGHMLLADNTSAILLSLAIGLILLKNLHHKPLVTHDLIFISVLSFLSVLSSLTYLYLLIFLYLFIYIEYFNSNNLSFRNIRNYFSPFLIFASPFAIFILYLLLTGSIGDYFYQNFVFNQKYYIYNYPRAPGETFINPVRFAIIIAHEFLMSFTDLLNQIKDFNFYFPFNITLAVGNTVLLIYLFVNKKYKMLLFMILMLIYANGRSNPLTSGERDYQSAVYIFISIFNICYLLYALYDELKDNLDLRKKVVYSALLIILFIYSFAAFLFLGRKFIDKAFQKYMGKAPLIYDRPQIAPIMNIVLSPNDFTWIGPFEFEELFYTKEKNASQYQIFNPGMGRSEKIQDGLISDFEKNKPKLIWFDKKFYILGENPEKYGQPFINYLNQHYFTLLDYRENGFQYKSVKPIDQRTDIETKLYIRHENSEEILQKLVDAGIIYKVAAQ